MNRMLRNATFAVVVGLALAAVAPSSSALAQRPYGNGNVHFDAHVSFPGWYGAFGGGFRVDITLTPNGVINGIDDELTLSLGADLFWFYWREYNGFGIAPLAVVQWNFWISREWSVFPELGIAFIFGPNDWNNRYYGSYVGPAGGFGARWNFSPDAALLLRVSWPGGFEIGIAF